MVFPSIFVSHDEDTATGGAFKSATIKQLWEIPLAAEDLDLPHGF